MKFVNIGGARAAILEYRNNAYYLLYNGFAMFEIFDMFGKDFVKKIGASDTESFNALVETIRILSKHGEQARRAIGLDAAPTFSDAEIPDPVFIGAGEIMKLRNSCIGAINLGYEREVTEEDEEIDLGLLELQKKRKVPEQNISN